MGEKTIVYILGKDGEVIERVINTSDLERIKEFPNRWYLTKHKNSFVVLGNYTINGVHIKMSMKRWLNNGLRVEKYKLNEEELRYLFIEKRHNIRFIAKKLGVSYGLVQERLKEYGIKLDTEEAQKRRKEYVPHNFKGYKITQRGYTYIKDISHPHANRDGYVMEHRIVVEKFIGRHLKKNEQVHHINLNKKDNEISNLVLFNNAAEHTMYHKYLEKLCVYLIGYTPDKPKPLCFNNKVLYRGEWTIQIDLAHYKERL